MWSGTAVQANREPNGGSDRTGSGCKYRTGPNQILTLVRSVRRTGSPAEGSLQYARTCGELMPIFPDFSSASLLKFVRMLSALDSAYPVRAQRVRHCSIVTALQPGGMVDVPGIRCPNSKTASSARRGRRRGVLPSRFSEEFDGR